VNGVPVISDGKTPATEEQIEARETHIINYDKSECLAQHVILLTTSTHLGMKIKDLKIAKEMWDIVKADATTKSMLYLFDTEDQLASMNSDVHGPASSRGPGQAGPKSRPDHSFGLARDSRKPKPLAQAMAFE
jgi:hypothetical protein